MFGNNICHLPLFRKKLSRITFQCVKLSNIFFQKPLSVETFPCDVRLTLTATNTLPQERNWILAEAGISLDSGLKTCQLGHGLLRCSSFILHDLGQCLWEECITDMFRMMIMIMIFPKGNCFCQKSNVNVFMCMCR